MASADTVREVINGMLAQRDTAKLTITPPPIQYMGEMDSVGLKIDARYRDLAMRIVETAFPDERPAMSTDNSGHFDLSFENGSKTPMSKAVLREKFFDGLARAADNINMFTARVNAMESPTATAACLGAAESFGGDPVQCSPRSSSSRNR